MRTQYSRERRSCPSAPPPTTRTHRLIHTTKRVFNPNTHTRKKAARHFSLTRSSRVSLPVFYPWGGRWWVDGKKRLGGVVGTRGVGGELERQRKGDDGLKLIWIYTNTSSLPLTSNLNRDQLAASVTMTTSVNHAVGAGFQMGTNGCKTTSAQDSAHSYYPCM